VSRDCALRQHSEALRGRTPGHKALKEEVVLGQLGKEFHLRGFRGSNVDAEHLDAAVDHAYAVGR
jgi:hypothetical protein